MKFKSKTKRTSYRFRIFLLGLIIIFFVPISKQSTTHTVPAGLGSLEDAIMPTAGPSDDLIFSFGYFNCNDGANVPATACGSIGGQPVNDGDILELTTGDYEIRDPTIYASLGMSNINPETG